jgi:hypothetical protein
MAACPVESRHTIESFVRGASAAFSFFGLPRQSFSIAGIFPNTARTDRWKF